MRALPAMPTQPAIAVCAPIRQLWPIWIWLSSLTSSSITVSSIAPRSIVVLAPISTSAPIDHAADLRDLEPAAALLRHAEAVGADDRAAVDDRARADRRVRAYRTTRGCSTTSSPTLQSSPIDAAGADPTSRSPMLARCADHRRTRRSSRWRRRGALVATTAVGWMPGGDRLRRMQDAPRRCAYAAYGFGGDELRQRGVAPASRGATMTALARVVASCAAIPRIGEERDRARRRRARACATRDRSATSPSPTSVAPRAASSASDFRAMPPSVVELWLMRSGRPRLGADYLSASALITLSVMSMRWLA